MQSLKCNQCGLSFWVSAGGVPHMCQPGRINYAFETTSLANAIDRGVYPELVKWLKHHDMRLLGMLADEVRTFANGGDSDQVARWLEGKEMDIERSL